MTTPRMTPHITPLSTPHQALLFSLRILTPFVASSLPSKYSSQNTPTPSYSLSDYITAGDPIALEHYLSSLSAGKTPTVMASYLNTCDEAGYPPLILAIVNNEEETIARTLIKQGADLDHPDELGIAPLFYAIQYSKPAFIAEFFEERIRNLRPEHYGQVLNALLDRYCMAASDELLAESARALSYVLGLLKVSAFHLFSTNAEKDTIVSTAAKLNQKEFLTDLFTHNNLYQSYIAPLMEGNAVPKDSLVVYDLNKLKIDLLFHMGINDESFREKQGLSVLMDLIQDFCPKNAHLMALLASTTKELDEIEECYEQSLDIRHASTP